MSLTLVGAFVGLFVGALVGAFEENARQCELCCFREISNIDTACTLTLVGAFVGLFVGAFVGAWLICSDNM